MIFDESCDPLFDQTAEEELPRLANWRPGLPA
jgi:hypothetical protein